MALIFLFAILLLLIPLLIAVKARLAVALCGDGAFVSVELGLWLGLVKIRVKRAVAWESMTPLVLGRGGRASARGLGGAIRLEHICITGRIPGSWDAGRAAIASGLLNGLATAAGSALGARTVSLVTPDFVSDALWVNLEGILTLRPGKLIIIAAGNAATEVIKHVASDRKHNADKHGAAEGDGGR